MYYAMACFKFNIFMLKIHLLGRVYNILAVIMIELLTFGYYNPPFLNVYMDYRFNFPNFSRKKSHTMFLLVSDL